MATYYVDVTTGDNGDNGTTEALAWADLGYAANQVAAGDIVYVKASASYTADDPDTATTNWEITTAGTAVTPIVWIGYTTTITDGGVVTVDAQDTNTSALLISGTLYNVFKNFHFTQADGDGVSGTAADRVTFKNCRSSNNANSGFTLNNYGLFEGCVADTNTAYGFDLDVENILVCCIAHTNTSMGFHIDNRIYVQCLSYNNSATSSSIQMANTTAGLFFGCSVDGENGASSIGIRNATANGCSIAVVNNILFDCDVGVYNNSNCGELTIARNNLFYSNNTNRTNFLVGEGDVTGSSDPFTASATRDYTLKDGSEAIDAGYDASETVTAWGL